jgi:signal transduction histidine kinase
VSATHHGERPAPRHEASGIERRRALRHDLRQSLGTVNALVTVIEDRPERIGELLQRLEQIRHEVGWMTRMLREADRDVPGPGTPGPGAFRVEAPVDVGAVTYAAWAGASSAHTCRIRLVHETRGYTLADPVAVRRAVHNLIDNAVRAAGPRGRVEVVVRANDGQVGVEVSDDGPGFGHVATQEGLGLTSVRELVRQLRGRLVIERAVLGGASVAMWLPAAEAAQKGRPS